MKEKININDLKKVFLRSNLLQGSWNFERMHALGFCYALIPIIEKLYKNNIEIKKKVLKRHLEFFNTHPYMTSIIFGIVIAMEEKKANGEEDINDNSINSVKIGLMGPLAGIGDSIFWGTLRPILSALGASISMTGNFLGPIIFFVSFNSIRLFIRYYGIIYGYNKGINFISDIKKNLLNKINEASSIIGLFIMGALINKWTHINIPYVIYKINENNNIKSITIQDTLDKIMPGLIPILLTFICMWLLKKQIKVLWLIFGIFIFGIIGYKIGLLN